MYSKVEKYITQVNSRFDSIPSERKEKLGEVSDYIRSKLENNEKAKLNFICTHNSRRSHIAQIWTAIAAQYYEINNVETFSGGTEATAFNPRAVSAIRRSGVKVEDAGGKNPKYKLTYSDEAEPMICFSKTFDDALNPKSSFAAIMTCSDADQNCPLVPGAEFRASVTYKDPKESDGTENESQIYDERCMQIATEMFYLMSRV